VAGVEPASALGHPLFTPVVLRLTDALPGRSLLVRREHLDSPWQLVHVHAPGASALTGAALAGAPGRATQTEPGVLDGASDPPGDARARVSTTLTPPYPQLESWLAAHHGWNADAVLSALAGDLHDEPGQPAGARVLPLDAYAAIVWVDPAEAVAQLAEKERESFVYTVSHDLRAPIRVIEGFTRIIKEDHGPALDRIGNDHLDRVLGAAARMTSMIDALLTLSRLSTRPLACEPVDLSAMAAQVIDELRRQAPERQAEASIEPGLIVNGDAALLRSMLDNLLGNAWKYCARRDVTRIDFGLHHDGVDTRASQRVFCVRDNGAGFDMRFADRLFGPFQRLHSASEFAGNGVGLASVRRIVRRHGGEIWAEAQVDQGANFYFTLP
jgi:signal transduction histidine kinase